MATQPLLLILPVTFNTDDDDGDGGAVPYTYKHTITVTNRCQERWQIDNILAIKTLYYIQVYIYIYYNVSHNVYDLRSKSGWQ